MKDQNDNKTQDWCEETQPHLSLSKSMLKFDRIASFMSKAVHQKGRVSSKDFMDFTGSGLRSAQRDLKALSKMGYLTTDECMPKGYLPTEKAKMIFGGAKWLQHLQKFAQLYRTWQLRKVVPIMNFALLKQ